MVGTNNFVQSGKPLGWQNGSDGQELKFGINYLYKELKKIDEEYSKKLSPNDTQRIIRALEVNLSTKTNLSDWHRITKNQIFKKIIYVVVKTEREKLYSRINKRVDNMIKEGLIKELRSLINYKNKNALKTVGYKEMFEYING